MAREKVLYEEHSVLPSATSAAVARRALKLIEVEYEVLPHVINVDDAMADDAPLLFDDMITRGMDPAPEKPSNIARKRVSNWVTSRQGSPPPTKSSKSTLRLRPYTKVTSSPMRAWRMS